MLYIGLVLGSLLFALQAIRAARTMFAAIWLACSSALIAALLYAMGAREIAIIELSVGAGLVTVLFAFALNFVGESTTESVSVIPRPLVLALLLHVMVFLGWLISPPAQGISVSSTVSFTDTLWRDRSLDVLGQIALITVGVLVVLGLLVEFRIPNSIPPKALFDRPLAYKGTDSEPLKPNTPQTAPEISEKTL